LFLPPDNLKSKFFSLLQPEPWKMGLWQTLPKTAAAFGTFGAPSYTTISPMPYRIFHRHLRQNKLPSWEPLPNTYGQDTIRRLAAEYQPKPCQWHFEPSPRQSNWMENQTLWSRRKGATIEPLPTSSKDIDARTPLPKPN
jgi:hypothetical protein